MQYWTYKKWMPRIIFFPQIITCDLCSNRYDNEDSLHFNRCEELGVCIDCDPNDCKGKYFKSSE